MSPSAESVRYESSVWAESEAFPGVRYRIARLSLMRRIELTKQVRELLARMEFHAAGEELTDRLEAAEYGGRIEGLYVRWGLMEIAGLEIDGRPATPEAVIEAGPEALVQEIAARIRSECRLTEAERKN
jgi:hypothetical protein